MWVTVGHLRILHAIEVFLETKLRWAIRKHFFPFGMLFYIWNGFVCWKLTSSSTWSPSRGVGWSFWKVAWLPWLIHGSGTRTTSVKISQRVGEALVQSSIKIWQQLKCPPLKGVVRMEFFRQKYWSGEEEPRWRRTRMGRPLSPLQIHRKDNWTAN